MNINDIEDALYLWRLQEIKGNEEECEWVTAIPVFVVENCGEVTFIFQL